MLFRSALALTFPIVLTTAYLGDPDNGAVLSGYMGSLLLGGAYLGVTELMSAITRNQIIAFIISVVVCFFLILCGWEPVTQFLVNHLPDGVVNLVKGLSTWYHFLAFQRGVIDLRDLLYFGSVIGFSLFATSVVLRGVHYIGYGDKFDESKLHKHEQGTFFNEPAKTAHFGMTKSEGAILYFYGHGPTGSTALEKLLAGDRK